MKSKIKELFAIDLRSLALLRASMALLILVDLLTRILSLNVFYTDTSAFPRALAIWLLSPWDFSIYFANGTFAAQIALFLIAAFFAILLLIGWHTRLATFMSWFLLLSLHSRNPMVPSGGDYLLRLFLFWSLFLPLGARFSVDSASSPSTQSGPLWTVSIGTAALLAQVAFVYWSAAVAKIGSDVWRSGDAVYYALSLNHYAQPFGQFLLHHSSPSVLKFLTHSVVLFEFLGPFILFSPIFTGPVRIVTIVGFLCLQLGFGLCIDLELFPWISSAAMIPFLPSLFWDGIVNRLELRKYFRWEAIAGSVHSHLARLMKVRPSPLAVNILAGFFLLYIFISNLEGAFSKGIIPGGLRWLGDLLSLDQTWSMFVPPGEYSVWFVIPGKLKDGTEVDLLKNSSPVAWDKPSGASTTFKTDHWRSYLLTLWGGQSQLLSPYLSWYLCSEWNRSHREEMRLEELEIFAVAQRTLLNQQTAAPQSQSLFKYSC